MIAGEEPPHRNDISSDRMVIAMRDSAARLNGIIQSAMDAIITVDERQDIVIFNPAAELMFGSSAASVLGTPLQQFIPLRFRDAHIQHIYRFGKTGISTRKMGAESEIVGLRANGEEFPLEASISQVVLGDKKLFTVILRDITLRRRADEQLRDSAERHRRLMELIPDAIWIERAGRIAYMNRACMEMVAAESASEVLDKSPLDFIHPEFHALAVERRRHIETGIDVNPRIEKRIVRLDGETRDVEIAEATFHDQGSIAILAVLRDITPRKRIEQAMIDQRQQLRELSAALQSVREEEKARLARELHDELGQALTGLKMDLAQIVTDLSPGQSAALDRAAAMRALIESTVQSVRRMATELRPLMLDDLGLASTIEWVVDDFSKLTGVQVELHLPQSDFDAEPGLSTALFRVLQESLTNVTRHAQASRARIALSVSDGEVGLRR